ncbi:MAG TPA: GNAT family N-acetyltransferase [Candidatus Deferrimicrobium sp.]|nr:GNAT family N-acetyltransferase [Candidatus Deferrimicrobium sp.]
MDFEIKIIQDPIPAAKISELYKKTYFEKYFDSGANDWGVEYTKWYFGAYHHDKQFFYSAWKGDQLIATLLGTPNKIKFDNELDFNTISLGLAATHPEFQRQGIQKTMLQRLIEDAKKNDIDLIYSFPEQGFGGNDLLKKHFNFKRYLKNQQHYIKVMSDYGRKILHEYRGLNIVLAKLLKLYDGIPDNKVEGGELRDGKNTDIGQIVKILNSYQKRLPLSQIWTEAHLTEEIVGAGRLNEMFDPPWAYNWKVWERDGKILGTLFIRFEMIYFKNGNAPVALISETCFDESATESEKAGVIATIVRWVQKEHPKVFTIQTTQPQYELDVYKSLKFIDDTSTYEFLALPLSTKGEAMNRDPKKKFKEFFIPYHR